MTFSLLQASEESSLLSHRVNVDISLGGNIAMYAASCWGYLGPVHGRIGRPVRYASSEKTSGARGPFVTISKRLWCWVMLD
jgi:hypothetical protein